MEKNVIIDGIYKHYKGNQYKVIGLAKHSETQEEMVVYQAEYGNHDLWVRSLKMFMENVEVGGQKVPRFKYINR